MHGIVRVGLVTCCLLWPALAGAQDAPLDDKLRDLLHQSTTQLRAAEDSAATLQTQLDAMTRQRDQLQQQLTAEQARRAAPIAPPVDDRAAAELAAARAQNARLAAGARRLQAAYAQAAGMARDKDASDRRNAAGLRAASSQLTACKSANSKLIDLSTGILHLYQTPKWNELLVANHDRLLGFKRVELENLVQDYEDRIESGSYVPTSATASP